MELGFCRWFYGVLLFEALLDLEFKEVVRRAREKCAGNGKGGEMGVHLGKKGYITNGFIKVLGQHSMRNMVG